MALCILFICVLIRIYGSMESRKAALLCCVSVNYKIFISLLFKCVFFFHS